MLTIIRAVGLAGVLFSAIAGMLLWMPILAALTALAAVKDAYAAWSPRSSAGRRQ